MKKIRVIPDLVMVNLYLGIKIPATISITVQEKLLVVMGEFNICPRPVNITPKGKIVGVMVKDVAVGLNRSATLPCSMFGEIVDGDGIVVYRYQASLSPSH